MWVTEGAPCHGTTLGPAVSYHIYVPRGGALTCLPHEYDTIEDAVLAFELDHDDAPWCLLDRFDKDRSPFVLRGLVEGSRVAWRPVHC